MSNINDRIKKIRLDSKLTQADFAKELHISREYVSRIENGKDNPSGAIKGLICVKFNINSIWLETGEGKINRKHNSIDKYRYVLDDTILSEWLHTNNVDDFYNFYHILNAIIEILTYKSVQKNSRVYYTDKIKSIISSILGYIKIYDMDEVDNICKNGFLTESINQYQKLLCEAVEAFSNEDMDETLVEE